MPKIDKIVSVPKNRLTLSIVKQSQTNSCNLKAFGWAIVPSLIERFCSYYFIKQWHSIVRCHKRTTIFILKFRKIAGPKEGVPKGKFWWTFLGLI